MRSGDLSASPVSNSLSNVVARATAILEEELASSILCSRHAESPLPPGLPIPGADGGELGFPWKRQGVRQAVDTFLIWLSQATAAADVTARPEESVLFLRPSRAVHPGETAGLTVQLHNESTIDSPPFDLYCTDLHAGPEQRIAAADVTLSPASIRLGAAARISIRIEIRVPADALPGSYSGLLLAKGLDHLQAVLKLQVG